MQKQVEIGFGLRTQGLRTHDCLCAHPYYLKTLLENVVILQSFKQENKKVLARFPCGQLPVTILVIRLPSNYFSFCTIPISTAAVKLVLPSLGKAHGYRNFETLKY